MSLTLAAIFWVVYMSPCRLWHDICMSSRHFSSFIIRNVAMTRYHCRQYLRRLGVWNLRNVSSESAMCLRRAPWIADYTKYFVLTFLGNIWYAYISTRPLTGMMYCWYESRHIACWLWNNTVLQRTYGLNFQMFGMLSRSCKLCWSQWQNWDNQIWPICVIRIR